MTRPGEGNLFDEAPADGGGAERVSTLLEVDGPQAGGPQAGGFTLKRIVSAGQTTPDGVWWAQDDNEWVVLLSGGATLVFEGDDRARRLRPGDYVHIPAHLRHRVEWTDPDHPTVWLALHYG